MNKQDFQSLDKGDKVVFTNAMGMTEVIHDYPAANTILTRQKDWMDDGDANMFTWNDGANWHYFYAEDVEPVKEAK